MNQLFRKQVFRLETPDPFDFEQNWFAAEQGEAA